MNVLLCTPYTVDPQFVQGGIVIWAQNIVEYYNTLATDLYLQVAPFDRRVRDYDMDEGDILKRACFGLADYHGAIKNARRILKCGRFDVLHLCTSASISLLKDILILTMARRKGVKTVVHFHFGRIPALVKKGNWEWTLLKRVMRLADAVVTMDLKSNNALLEQGFKNVYYLPNPLSQNVLRTIKSEASKIVRKDRRLCFVGHVIPTKGVFELVEACKDIKDIELHVVGKSTEDVRRQMEQMSRHGEWLVLEGEVNHQQVIREMLSSGMFVLPTYTEGFPNVILESMACGCAIVTTPVGAIPEMLDIASSTPCGTCCEPKDVDGLRRNIQFFLDYPEESRKYADRAVKRVNEMYAIPKVWEQLVKIWKGVC